MNIAKYRCLLFVLFFIFAGCKKESAIAIGEQAPSFALQDLEGKSVSLADYKGRVVLLNFWATWCPPCVAEMKSLNELYLKFKDKGVVVVAISADTKEAEEQVRQFVKEKQLAFPVLLDPDTTVAPRYNVGGFPETYFIDRSGKFVSFFDAEQGQSVIRVVADRVWNSEQNIKAITTLLEGMR